MPKKSIPIELGGKTRHLRYDFNALVTLEETLGIPIVDIGEKISGSVKLGDLRSIIWAGLLHENAEISEVEVGRWLDFPILGMVAEKIGQAFEAAFPPTSDDPKNEPSPQNKK